MRPTATATRLDVQADGMTRPHFDIHQQGFREGGLLIFTEVV
jgi:hypothetical protein